MADTDAVFLLSSRGHRYAWNCKGPLNEIPFCVANTRRILGRWDTVNETDIPASNWLLACPCQHKILPGWKVTPHPFSICFKMFTRSSCCALSLSLLLFFFSLFFSFLFVSVSFCLVCLFSVVCWLFCIGGMCMFIIIPFVMGLVAFYNKNIELSVSLSLSA